MKQRDFNAKYFDSRIYKKLHFDAPPSRDLKLIVTIPAFDEGDIEQAIFSILKSKLKQDEFEILVLLNYPNSASDELKRLANTQKELLDSIPNVSAFKIEFPDKIAGVGLARKILMDAASQRFYTLGKSDGVILTFDADCLCDEWHMDNVLSYFELNNNIEAASIYFEHDINDALEPNKSRIIEYEIHLRAYINWKKYIGLPFAYQTIGSSMAVRAGAYSLKGGMNRRKAGEDFYFLHKFTSLGNFGEIKNTTVYPSARVSNRVPFGTGRAILEAVNNNRTIGTYHYQSFLDFKPLVDGLEQIFKQGTLDSINLNDNVRSCLILLEIENIIKESIANATNFDAFKRRFYNRFNAFLFMKYLHYMRDHHYPNISAMDSANKFISMNEAACLEKIEDCLDYYRMKDSTNAMPV